MIPWMVAMAWAWASGAVAAELEPAGEAVSDVPAAASHAPLPPRLEEVESVRPLELHAWAAVGYRADVQVGEGVTTNPYVSLARVQARVLEHGFGAFLQLGADRGEVVLLDARSTWRPSEHFWLRAGRFKTPVSAEFLVPGNHLLLPTRGAHVGLVSGRALGAEMHLRLPVGGGLLVFQPGIFDPVGGTTPTLDVGQQAVGRLLWQTGTGLQLHAAASTWLRDDDAAQRLGELAPDNDRHLAGAVLFEDPAWTGVLEGVWARPTAGGPPVWGGTATLARRFATAWDGIEVEPVIALEVVDRGEGLRELGRVGLNIHHFDWRVVQMIAAEVDHRPGQTNVVGYLQLRAGM